MSAVKNRPQPPGLRSRPGSKWHVSDLLRGITPKSMLSEWSSVFRSPKSIARTVLHKFVRYLEA
ncbi:hypothetical protein BKA57DRAFT_499588 [Linnemannia elongata]|nr:hypothetical protein BKA57DRAFT_499588 [Linnemannia elongata]